MSSITDRFIPNRRTLESVGLENFHVKGLREIKLSTTNTLARLYAQQFHPNGDAKILSFKTDYVAKPYPKLECVQLPWQPQEDRTLDAPGVNTDFYNRTVCVDPRSKYCDMVLCIDGVYKVYSSNITALINYRVTEYSVKFDRLNWISMSVDFQKLYVLGRRRDVDQVTQLTEIDRRTQQCATVNCSRGFAESCCTFTTMDRNALAFGNLIGRLKIFDLRANRETQYALPTQKRVQSVVMNDSDANFFSVSQNDQFSVFDRRKIESPLLNYPISGAKAAAFQPDGQGKVLVGSGVGDGKIRSIHYKIDPVLFENLPAMDTRVQITAIKWLEATQFYFSTGYHNETPECRVYSVRKKADHLWSVNGYYSKAEVRFIEMERLENWLLVLSQNETLRVIPMQEQEKKTTKPSTSSINQLSEDLMRSLTIR